MKKLLLAVVLLMVLVGCKSTNEKNAVTELIEQGYRMACSTFDEDEWKAMMTNDQGDYIVLKADLTSKMFNEIDEIFLDDVKYMEYVAKLEIEEQTNVSDRLPSVDDMKDYIGKTIGDLENDGYWQSGYMEGENGLFNFTYDNDVYCLTVCNRADMPINNMDDMSENDIRALEIGGIIAVDFSSNFLYEE